MMHLIIYGTSMKEEVYIFTSLKLLEMKIETRFVVLDNCSVT
jgi:hypothetical protein